LAYPPEGWLLDGGCELLLVLYCERWSLIDWGGLL